MQDHKPYRRLAYIDLLRGWAVIIMIETHVVNALLLPEYRTQTPFAILTFFNGLVAPSFLFCAGFALAITLSRKWNDYLQLKFSFWRYLIRLLFILIVGYSLHLPAFSLRKMLTVTDPHRWQLFFQSDILHVISLTLLFAVLLAVIMRSRRIYDTILAIITASVIFLAPVVRGLDYSNTPIWLRSYFSIQYSSQFPLFPWSAFLLAGLLIGNWIQQRQDLLPALSLQSRLGVASITAIVVSLIAAFAPVTFYPNYNFWNASPEFFFVRLGIVCLLLVVCWLMESRPQGILRKAVILFGTESLLVYVVHLLLIYGHTYKFSLIRLFGKTLTYTECFLLSFGLIALMYLLALVWSSVKRWNKRIANIVQYATLAGIVIRFLVE